MGRTIAYKYINDHKYFIEWHSSGEKAKNPDHFAIPYFPEIVKENKGYLHCQDSACAKMLPDTFALDRNMWFPKVLTENKDYVVLSQSRGRRYLVGIILPVSQGKPVIVHDYLDFDLEHHLVAYLDGTDIKIQNLKTNGIEIHKTSGCQSAFAGDCMWSVSIQDKVLKYRWIPETKFKSQRGVLHQEAIRL